MNLAQIEKNLGQLEVVRDIAHQNRTILDGLILNRRTKSRSFREVKIREKAERNGVIAATVMAVLFITLYFIFKNETVKVMVFLYVVVAVSLIVFPIITIVKRLESDRDIPKSLIFPIGIGGASTISYSGFKQYLEMNELYWSVGLILCGVAFFLTKRKILSTI